MNKISNLFWATGTDFEHSWKLLLNPSSDVMVSLIRHFESELSKLFSNLLFSAYINM